MLTPETETYVRSLLTQKIVEVETVGVGISEPVFFDSKADFAAQTGVTAANATDEANAAALDALNCNFSMVSFARFDDTKKGTVRCPVMLVTYELLIFQEFRRGLESETNAHNRHVSNVLLIWAKFLSNHVLREDPLIRHQGIEQIGKTAKNQGTEHLPGVKGFYSILQTKVEVA